VARVGLPAATVAVGGEETLAASAVGTADLVGREAPPALG